MFLAIPCKAAGPGVGDLKIGQNSLVVFKPAFDDRPQPIRSVNLKYGYFHSPLNHPSPCRQPPPHHHQPIP